MPSRHREETDLSKVVAGTVGCVWGQCMHGVMETGWTKPSPGEEGIRNAPWRG